MTASLGGAALALAFITAIAAGALALRGRKGEQRWVDLSRRAVYGLCGLLTFCVVLIELAFARDDFSFKVVQQHSSIDTPTFYKLAAMWSSQEGSLLLWAWVLSIAASRGAFRDPQPAARDRSLRDRGDGRHRRLLHRADALRRRRQPVLDREPGADRRAKGSTHCSSTRA